MANYNYHLELDILCSLRVMQVWLEGCLGRVRAGSVRVLSVLVSVIDLPQNVIILTLRLGALKLVLGCLNVLDTVSSSWCMHVRYGQKPLVLTSTDTSVAKTPYRK